MAPAENHGFVLAVAARVAIVEGLLAGNPACAVGVFDPARNIADAGATLARVGIRVNGHACLKAGALAEFVALSDIGLMTDAALEANVRGSATRTLRLRDGQLAELHLIEISYTERTTVAVVPGAGETIAATPPPTAFVASPRVGVVTCDAFSAITSASDSTLVLLGRPNEPIEGMSAVQLLHPEDQEMALVNWLAAKEQRGVALRWRCRIVSDISSEVAATDALIAERELIALLTETLPVGVAKFDACGHLEHANGRLTKLLAPLDPADLLRRAVRGELEAPDVASAFTALVRDGAASRFIVDHRGVGGAVRHLEWTIRAAVGVNGEVTGRVLCIADVTEAAQLRDPLERRARTDALTGCLNRAGTIAALRDALANLGPSDVADRNVEPAGDHRPRDAPRAAADRRRATHDAGHRRPRREPARADSGLESDCEVLRLHNVHAVPVGELPLESAVLRVAIAYDRLEASGKSREAAVDVLRSRDPMYEAGVLDILEAYGPESLTDKAERAVSVDELVPHVLLTRDITGSDGSLLLGIGHELSDVIIQRLRTLADRQIIRELVLVSMPDDEPDTPEP